MTAEPSITQGWPASLQDIAELIGVAATLRLVDAYGGSVLYVPMTLDPGHRLVQSIGPKAAAELVRVYGAEKVEVPVLRVARSRKALIAGAEGKTREVARTIGVTERYVRMVRNDRKRPDDRQSDLLDFLAARRES